MLVANLIAPTLLTAQLTRREYSVPCSIKSCVPLLAPGVLHERHAATHTKEFNPEANTQSEESGKQQLCASPRRHDRIVPQLMAGLDCQHDSIAAEQVLLPQCATVPICKCSAESIGSALSLPQTGEQHRQHRADTG